jgi:hypothetical protein
MVVRMVKPKVVDPGSLMLETNVYYSGLLHMTLECMYVGIPNFEPVCLWVHHNASTLKGDA